MILQNHLQKLSPFVGRQLLRIQMELEDPEIIDIDFENLRKIIENIKKTVESEKKRRNAYKSYQLLLLLRDTLQSLPNLDDEESDLLNTKFATYYTSIGKKTTMEELVEDLKQESSCEYSMPLIQLQKHLKRGFSLNIDEHIMSILFTISLILNFE